MYVVYVDEFVFRWLMVRICCLVFVWLSFHLNMLSIFSYFIYSLFTSFCWLMYVPIHFFYSRIRNLLCSVCSYIKSILKMFSNLSMYVLWDLLIYCKSIIFSLPTAYTGWFINNRKYFKWAITKCGSLLRNRMFCIRIWKWLLLNTSRLFTYHNKLY